MKKKKEIDKMTSKEAYEELTKTMAKLEKLQQNQESEMPKLVESLIEINKRLYKLMKDPRAKEMMLNDKELRKALFNHASALGELENSLFQTEDLARQVVDELKKKQKKREG